jgi:hypothetical protein
VRVIIWWEYAAGTSHLEDEAVDTRIILKWILKKWDSILWNDALFIPYLKIY